MGKDEKSWAEVSRSGERWAEECRRWGGETELAEEGRNWLARARGPERDTGKMVDGHTGQAEG